MGRENRPRLNMPKLMFRKLKIPHDLDAIIEKSIQNIKLVKAFREPQGTPQNYRQPTCMLGENSIYFYSGVNPDSLISENLCFFIQLDTKVLSQNKMLQKLVLYHLRDFCLRNSVAEIAFASSCYEDIKQESLLKIIQAIKRRNIKILEDLRAEISQRSSIVGDLINFSTSVLNWNRFDEPAVINPVSQNYLLSEDYSLQAIMNNSQVVLGLHPSEESQIVLSLNQDEKLVDVRSFGYFAAQPEDWVLEILLEKPRKITELEELYNGFFIKIQEKYAQIRSELEEKGYSIES